MCSAGRCEQRTVLLFYKLWSSWLAGITCSGRLLLFNIQIQVRNQARLKALMVTGPQVLTSQISTYLRVTSYLFTLTPPVFVMNTTTLPTGYIRPPIR